MSKTIYADNIEHAEQSDAGESFHAQCPECKGSVHVAESQWWDSICECGYTWRLSISIEAEEQ